MRTAKLIEIELGVFMNNSIIKYNSMTIANQIQSRITNQNNTHHQKNVQS